MYDSIVVGAGVMGLSAAWELQRGPCGVHTLLLDQFPFPHTRGSSTGHSRAFRTAYRQPEYAALMAFSLEQWHHLEALTGRRLLQKCGLLLGGPSVDFQEYEAPLRDNRVPFEILTTEEVARRWPVYENFVSANGFLFDPSAGFIAADAAMQALKDAFLQAGGEFRPCEKMLELRSEESHVELVTDRGTYSTRSVVLAAGPWSIKMLQDLGLELPLQAVKALYMYFPAREKAEHLFTPQQYPVSMFKDIPNNLLVYSLPAFEFAGQVKFGFHGGPPCDPDRRDRDPYPLQTELRMRRHVAENFPQLEPEPVTVEYCMYTNTPDEGFILDRLPRDRRIVFGAGFSGHGFKLAPAVGRILAELALDRSPTVDGSAMRMARFMQKAKL